jgi:CheY-like chemotaxis protein
VLVVEDEAPVRRVLRRMLEAAGYRVLVAADGEEALRTASQSQTPVDLVITDLVMPRLGGGELVDRLRERDPALRVLFVSGYPDRGIDELGVGRPGTRFLPKPFATAELLVAVREMLAQPR